MVRGERRPLATVVMTMCFYLAAAGSADAQDKDPGSFLVALSQQAIAELSDQTIGEPERQQRFRDLLESNFDMRAIGRFVLGVYARSTDPSDQAAFLATFKEVLAQRFLPYFRDYRGEAFAVDAVKPDPTNPKLSLVISNITLESGNLLPVGWRIRRADGGFTIIDVVAEGVSMAITYRAEYTSVLKRTKGDLPGLTAELRAKIASGSFTPERD